MTRAEHRHRQARELACLALGHEDADANSCPSTDGELIADLVREVQALRLAAGIVEETPTDRAEQIGVLDDALDAAADAFATGPEHAQVVLDHLADAGWHLLPVVRP